MGGARNHPKGAQAPQLRRLGSQQARQGFRHLRPQLLQAPGLLPAEAAGAFTPGRGRRIQEAAQGRFLGERTETGQDLPSVRPTGQAADLAPPGPDRLGCLAHPSADRVIGRRQRLTLVGEDEPPGLVDRLPHRRMFAGQPLIDVAVNRSTQVEPLGPMPSQMGQGEGPGHDRHGAQGLGGKPGRHFVGDHAPQILLQGQAVDDLDRIGLRPQMQGAPPGRPAVGSIRVQAHQFQPGASLQAERAFRADQQPALRVVQGHCGRLAHRRNGLDPNLPGLATLPGEASHSGGQGLSVKRRQPDRDQGLFGCLGFFLEGDLRTDPGPSREGPGSTPLGEESFQ